eukprot:4506490-Pleurochrysis_carterae.AAC.1
MVLSSRVLSAMSVTSRSALASTSSRASACLPDLRCEMTKASGERSSERPDMRKSTSAPSAKAADSAWARARKRSHSGSAIAESARMLGLSTPTCLRRVRVRP